MLTFTVEKSTPPKKAPERVERRGLWTFWILPLCLDGSASRVTGIRQISNLPFKSKTLILFPKANDQAVSHETRIQLDAYHLFLSEHRRLPFPSRWNPANAPRARERSWLEVIRPREFQSIENLEQHLLSTPADRLPNVTVPSALAYPGNAAWPGLPERSLFDLTARAPTDSFIQLCLPPTFDLLFYMTLNTSEHILDPLGYLVLRTNENRLRHVNLCNVFDDGKLCFKAWERKGSLLTMENLEEVFEANFQSWAFSGWNNDLSRKTIDLRYHWLPELHPNRKVLFPKNLNPETISRGRGDTPMIWNTITQNHELIPKHTPDPLYG